MSDIMAVRLPELLLIDDEGRSNYGANQLWYKNYWRRQAGCGPTACSLLIWYLSRTRESCWNLCEHDAQSRTAFVRLMDDVWKSVTPTIMGLNSTRLFINGVRKYAGTKGVTIDCRSLEIPARRADRPTIQQLHAFILAAIADDLPIAFLNLSNGDVANLDKWHWVTIAGVRRDEPIAIVYDQGCCKEIDMALWLNTTTTGGGLVAIYPDERSLQ